MKVFHCSKHFELTQLYKSPQYYSVLAIGAMYSYTCTKYNYDYTFFLSHNIHIQHESDPLVFVLKHPGTGKEYFKEDSPEQVDR